MREEWNSFVNGIWTKEINVRDFIQKNYHPYEGDESFLCDATETTKELWAQVMDLVRHGAMGNLVEVESADGYIVRIFVE